MISLADLAVASNDEYYAKAFDNNTGYILLYAALLISSEIALLVAKNGIV